MKQRFIREGDELKDNSSVVVRGGPLDPEVITPDALRHHDIYGTYGISVFAIRDTTLDELAQQPPLIRFELLTVIVVGVLREAGLLLQPTGRNPSPFHNRVRCPRGRSGQVVRLRARSQDQPVLCE